MIDKTFEFGVYVGADKPADYNITLNDQELDAINDLIRAIDKSVIHKKNSNSKYTLIKSNANTYFVVGHGKQYGNKNAFFGKGTQGKVKATVPLLKEGIDKFKLSNEVYLVKTALPLAKDDIEQQKKEEMLFGMIYGNTELVMSDDTKKIYIIMPRLPGTELSKIKLSECSLDELSNIVIATYNALSKMHDKGVCHGDVHEGNINYDNKTKQAYPLDFGLGSLVRLKDGRYSDILRYKEMIKYLFEGYLEEHVTNMDFQSPEIKKNMFQQLDDLLNKLTNTKGDQFLITKDIEIQLLHDLRNIIFPIIDLDKQKFDLNIQFLAEQDIDKLNLLIKKFIKSNEIKSFEKIFSYYKSINKNGDDLESFLEEAIKADNNYVIKILIDAGAYTNRILRIAIFDNKLNRVRILLDNGVSPDIKEEDGKTGLMYAAYKKNTNIASYFIKKGADINLQSNKGWTVAMLAAANGMDTLVKLLCESFSQVDMNLQNFEGKTAIMLAIEHGHTNIACYLIQNKAMLDLIDCNGNNAMKLAQEKDDKDVMNLMASLNLDQSTFSL